MCSWSNHSTGICICYFPLSLLFRHAVWGKQIKQMLFTLSVRPCLIYDRRFRQRGRIELTHKPHIRHTSIYCFWKHIFGCNWSALHHLVNGNWRSVPLMWNAFHQRAHLHRFNHTYAYATEIWLDESQKSWIARRTQVERSTELFVRDVCDCKRDTNHHTRNRSPDTDDN